jgi:2-octaprenylphenol hydroxylase
LEATWDVAVVGGGLVGAALARALQGLSVALVAQPAAPAAPRGDALDRRVYALDRRVYAVSPGNAAFLARLGVWQRLPAGRLTPVRAMRVFGDDGASLVEFDATAAGVSELAWIVEDSVLQEALALERVVTGKLERLEITAKHAVLNLSEGRSLHARLVVGADGARSAVRTLAAIASEQRDYGQTAVVANFACGRPHRNVAFQWFQGGSVLALLPLPGDRVSMVWSVPDGRAAQLLALDAAKLACEATVASREILGELELLAAPMGLALQRLAARRLVAPRVALAGDAAHVIHPLAGQGANLGLQDAEALAATLAAREAFRDPGELRLLRRYARARAEPLLAMRAVVHGLYRLFELPGAAPARLRNAGLNLTDRVPVLKNAFIRHAMG